ncbi:MAG: hypothetical protein IKO61_12320 [Lachnospiraceae bacterium]|nr:hypothetical protein [Lachnospiraceae bacterium]
MEDGAVIRCRLDLLVRLIDTTTGQAVTERNVVFKNGDKKLAAQGRGDGNYIFIDTGRDNYLMTLSVFGYEDKLIDVNYETLDERMPSIDAFLLPAENTNYDTITLSGKRTGLVAVEAVQIGKPVCSISEFNKKDLKMTLFLANKQMNMEGGHYGLLHGEDSYEHIFVEKQFNPTLLKLKEELAEEFTVNSPICRVVFGEVGPKGAFRLRIRDSGGDLRYLVRYQIKDKVKFKVIDFKNDDLSEIKL